MARVGLVEKGPEGWSLKAVLNKKKSVSLRTALVLTSHLDPNGLHSPFVCFAILNDPLGSGWVWSYPSFVFAGHPFAS